METLARLYRAWMAFAEVLNRATSALLFGFIYLTVVPVFALLSGFQKNDRSPSQWRTRQRRTSGEDFFRRMS